MKSVIIFTVVLFAFSGLLFPFTSVEARSAKDTLTIHTVWVTGNNSCYHNDTQRMNEFQKEIILKYLTAYGLDLFYYNPTCMTEWEYNSYEPPNYTDLVIVVYNKNIGRDVLHERNMGGFFQWNNMETKNALRIETCECPSFDYNDSIWVLSHELAHFALYYLGYDRDIFEGYVHAVQSRYYQYCPDGDTTNLRCDGLWQKFEGYSRDYKMMRVYPGATSVDPPQAKFVNYLGSKSNPTTLDDKFEFQKEKEVSETHKKNLAKLQQEKQDREEKKKKQYLQDVRIIQQNLYVEHEKLQRGIIDAENSLKGLSGKSKLEQDRINKAWDLLKDSKNKVEKLKENYANGDREMGKGTNLIGNAHAWYLTNQNYPGKIGENLIQISSLIENVKTNEVYAEQNKTCFMFWCW